MKKFASVLSICALALCFAAPAFAQADPMFFNNNWRVGKMLNTPVYNDNNEMIGRVDDILIPAIGSEFTAVLAIHTDKGMKMVRVPLSHLKMAGGKVMMSGKDGMMPALMAMPAFTYGLSGGGG